MNYMDLNKDFAIGTSPTPDDLNRLKASGFKSIVDLRVSGEVGAPSISDEQEVARSLELTLLHIAVPARTLPGELLDLFRREVPSLPKRIFVHCTKGGRAALFHWDSSGARGRRLRRRYCGPRARGRFLRRTG